jgi:hypothetical protein
MKGPAGVNLCTAQNRKASSAPGASRAAKHITQHLFFARPESTGIIF